MIYYNLVSKYPGDITKHCGLTIDEVDNNFYELETGLNDLKNSGVFNQKRLWAFSDPNNLPYNNTVTTSTDEDVCTIYGTVTNGVLMFGIDSVSLYGLSLWFDGKLLINDIEIPPHVYRYENMSLPLWTELTPNGETEFVVTIGYGNSPSDKFLITTVNRALEFKILYEKTTIASGKFVLDDDLIVEEQSKTVWYNDSVWKDTLVWLTA